MEILKNTERGVGPVVPSGVASGTTVAAIAAGRLDAGRDVNVHYHGHHLQPVRLENELPNLGIARTEWEVIKDHRTDGLAEIVLHEPQAANIPNKFYINTTIRFSRDLYEIDGKSIYIGLRDAFLLFQSSKYQVAHQSRVDERGNSKNFKSGVGGVTIVGPTDEHGCLSGNPLRDEYFALIEPICADDVASVTLSLHAGGRSFKVNLTDEEEKSEVHVNKDIVINALVRSFNLNKDNQGRVVVASAKIRWRSK